MALVLKTRSCYETEGQSSGSTPFNRGDRAAGRLHPTCWTLRVQHPQYMGQSDARHGRPRLSVVVPIKQERSIFWIGSIAGNFVAVLVRLPAVLRSTKSLGKR